MSETAPQEVPQEKTVIDAERLNQMRLQAYIKTILMTSIRGMMAANPKVKPEVFLLSSAMQLGSIIGEMYIGDEISVQKFRKGCRDAFADFLRSVPVQHIETEASQETAALNR